MTDARVTTPATTTTATDRGRSAASGTVLPLWVAAISLVVIAVVLIIASFQLLDALHSTQASLVQLQQQV